MKLAIQYRDRINPDLILPTVNWRNTTNKTSAAATSSDTPPQEQTATQNGKVTHPEQQLAAKTL